MNKWYRRFQVLLCIGGGLTGLVLTLHGFLVLKSTEVLTYFPYPIFATIFAYSVVVGLLFGEGVDCRHHLVFLYLPQILTFYSPMMSYHYYCGLDLFVGHGNGHLIHHFELGAAWTTWFLRPAPWVLGSNLFALLIFLFELTVWMRKLMKDSKVDVSIASSPMEPASATSNSPV